jgi:general secretion pathway protein G
MKVVLIKQRGVLAMETNSEWVESRGATAAQVRRFLRRAGRAWSRGVTLIEVMIVVVIIGLISGGVAVAVLPKLRQAQIDTTRVNARELRRAAEQWRGLHGDGQCPTAQVLRADKAIDTGSKLTDAWDNPYRIVCDDDETTVISDGPDKKPGTQDDIRVPEAPQPGK